jgi:hypothetical protein
MSIMHNTVIFIQSRIFFKLAQSVANRKVPELRTRMTPCTLRRTENNITRICPTTKFVKCLPIFTFLLHFYSRKSWERHMGPLCERAICSIYWLCLVYFITCLVDMRFLRKFTSLSAFSALLTDLIASELEFINTFELRNVKQIYGWNNRLLIVLWQCTIQCYCVSSVCCTVSVCDVLCLFVLYCVCLLCTVSVCDVLCMLVMYCVCLWFTVPVCDVLCLFVMYCVCLWCTVSVCDVLYLFVLYCVC